MNGRPAPWHVDGEKMARVMAEALEDVIARESEVFFLGGRWVVGVAMLALAKVIARYSHTKPLDVGSYLAVILPGVERLAREEHARLAERLN